VHFPSSFKNKSLHPSNDPIVRVVAGNKGHGKSFKSCSCFQAAVGLVPNLLDSYKCDYMKLKNHTKVFIHPV